MSLPSVLIVHQISRVTFGAFHQSGINGHEAVPDPLVFNYVTRNRKSYLSNNDYMPYHRTALSQRGESVKRTTEQIKKMIDALPMEEKEEIKRYLENKRDYNKNYSDVAKKVETHIRRHGHITNKEAHERGYTSKLLDTTTFHRCIISKLSIQVDKKRLPDRRIAFYDSSRGAPSSFAKIDNDLIEDIMNKIDLRFNQHDLRAIIDKQDYPAMKRKGSLRAIRPMMVKAMAKRGYSVVGNEMIFVRVH